MVFLILGLGLFLGIHSIGLLPACVKTTAQARFGVWGFKIIYSLISLAGFALMVLGFTEVKSQSALWEMTAGSGVHLINAVLTLFALMLIFAAYVPRNGFKTTFKHPQTLGVVVLCATHLLVIHNLAAFVVFAALLVWSALLYVKRLSESRAVRAQKPASSFATALVIVIGAAAWAAVVLQLHTLLLGVAPTIFG